MVWTTHAGAISHLAETVVCHEACSYQEGYRRAFDLLNLVKVPSAQCRLAAYPHELQG